MQSNWLGKLAILLASNALFAGCHLLKTQEEPKLEKVFEPDFYVGRDDYQGIARIEGYRLRVISCDSPEINGYVCLHADQVVDLFEVCQ